MSWWWRTQWNADGRVKLHHMNSPEAAPPRQLENLYENKEEAPNDNHPEQHVIYRAAKAGNLEAVEHWLTEGHPIDHLDGYGNSLLYYACLCEQFKVVHKLLDRGAFFSSKTPEGDRIVKVCSNEMYGVLNRYEKNNTFQIIQDRTQERWFEIFYNNPQFSDFEFIVGGQTISAHKVILAASCSNLIEELQQPQLVVPVENPKILSDLIKYVYCKKNNNLHGSAELAQKFGISTNKKSSITSRFQKLINSPKYSDITLVASDGGKLYAHKVILASKSDYFKAHFNNWGKTNSEMQIPEITHEVLSIILSFIYSRLNDEINENNILDVIAAADLFILMDLKTKLEIEVIQKYLDAENCFDLLMFAEMTNCTQLKKFCLSKILLNWDKNMKNENPGCERITPELQEEIKTLLTLMKEEKNVFRLLKGIYERKNPK